TNRVRKYLKSDLSYIGETASYGDPIRAIAIDDTHIYAGGGTTTNRVRKYPKSDLSQWLTFSEVLDRPGGGAWAVADLNNLQVAIGLEVPAANNAYCTQVYVEVDYTPILAPTVTTNPATEVGQTSATLNGTLDSDGGLACVCSFEYGETTAYGSTTAPQSKTTGQTFSQEVRGLRPGGILYHFRAKATNSQGTSYGVDRTFHTEALSAEAHQALGRHFAMGRW
ncbi:unnamed protein product, partial [marine sediment metagenome]